MRRVSWSALAAILALSACSDAFYVSFDVDVGTRSPIGGRVPDIDRRGPDDGRDTGAAPDVPEVPGRVTPSDAAGAPRFDPPPSCGAQPFRELRYVYDVEGIGDRIAVASFDGTWTFDPSGGPSGGQRLDGRPSWRVRADGDALWTLTHDRVLVRIARGERVELSEDRPLVDFVVRDGGAWASEEGSGDVLALGAGPPRVVANGRDAALMHADERAAYVAMPSFGVVRIRANGESDALYVAPPTEGVFAAVGQLVLDDDWVTFTAWPHGGLARVHKESGAFEALLDDEDKLVVSAARHGSALFWLEQDLGTDGEMRVMRAAADGSDAHVFLDGACVERGIGLDVLGDSLFVMMEGATLAVDLAAPAAERN